MVLFPQTIDQIECLIRKFCVKATPEEKVRQALLNVMLEELGYPFSYLTVEKEMRQFPHLKEISNKLPKRRIDIVCFAKGISPTHELSPLLLIECKAYALRAQAFQQLISYNYFIQAPYIAVVSQNELRIGAYNREDNEYQFTNGLPPYSVLLQSLSIKSP